MKKFLQDLIARKQKELADLKTRNEASEDLNEVRAIGSQIETINNEIREAQTKLEELEAEEQAELEKENEENRSGFNPNQALNVLADVKQNNGEAREIDSDPLGTIEYRKAFKDYIQRGVEDKKVLKYESRADATGTSANLGVLIPSTVVQKVITEVEKVRGQLYSRVLKTNIPGGVKYPIGSFSATFNRISETGKSDRQKAGEITGSVEFSYKIGEIRIARTLLQVVLSVDAFETEFAKVIATAYVEAMDKEIMTGKDDDNQMVGILTEAAKSNSRIKSSQIIEFTDSEMADWKTWQTKLFSKIPLSMRGLSPEFVMTANTYESNIKTLADDNNRPLYNETYNPVDGSEISKFKGKNVVFVEEDILKNFNDATNGEYFGMYWVPEKSYAINSNMEFVVMDYFDQETNQYVKKALVINDGKILDPKYIYLLKKKVTA